MLRRRGSHPCSNGCLHLLKMYISLHLALHLGDWFCGAAALQVYSSAVRQGRTTRVGVGALQEHESQVHQHTRLHTRAGLSSSNSAAAGEEVHRGQKNFFDDLTEKLTIPFMETQNFRSFIGLSHRQRPTCNCGCCILASHSTAYPTCVPVHFGQTFEAHSTLDCEVIATGQPESGQCVAGEGAVFMEVGSEVDKAHFCSTNCEPAAMFVRTHTAAPAAPNTGNANAAPAPSLLQPEHQKPPGPECVAVSNVSLSRLGLDPNDGSSHTNSLNLNLQSCDSYVMQLYGGSAASKSCAFARFAMNGELPDESCAEEAVCDSTAAMLHKLLPTFDDNTDCACQLCTKLTHWYDSKGDVACSNGESVRLACQVCTQPMSASGCDAFKVQHLTPAVQEFNEREGTSFSPVNVDMCMLDLYNNVPSAASQLSGFCSQALADEVGTKAVATLTVEEFDLNTQCTCSMCVHYSTAIEANAVQEIKDKCKSCVAVDFTAATVESCASFRSDTFNSAGAAWSNLKPGELETCTLAGFNKTPPEYTRLLNGLCTKNFICDALQNVATSLGTIPTGDAAKCPCLMCLEMRKYLASGGQGCQHALAVQKACQTCAAKSDSRIVTLPV
ncbi:unnamed protein product [Amoebophrya sp. A120]|nr:unnamed protein product [Amoebophrya sp. A120]|eukprot:GSA120T00006466001.1